MSNASRMLLALAGLMIVGSTAAQAVEYPYCLTYVEGWSGAIERCDFSMLAQCQASAAGLNGSCTPNRRAAPAATFSPDAVDGGRRSNRR